MWTANWSSNRSDHFWPQLKLFFYTFTKPVSVLVLKLDWASLASMNKNYPYHTLSNGMGFILNSWVHKLMVSSMFGWIGKKKKRLKKLVYVLKFQIRHFKGFFTDRPRSKQCRRWWHLAPENTQELEQQGLDQFGLFGWVPCPFGIFLSFCKKKSFYNNLIYIN